MRERLSLMRFLKALVTAGGDEGPIRVLRVKDVFDLILWPVAAATRSGRAAATTRCCLLSRERR
ncbi:hypothetical protein Sp245p_22380 (plasmid) [Azospirillum baldaniorum]|uniref:Uncharacterized protein n=1 Tax=Azospirillum baldaniorum TaxID=1064539 RepID=A0A9P1JWE8_9PROT|nr:hypothetical protein Sp245p_22380 [Azospirillum baldaniorum]CCD01058.1 protein of unknown function [Azospirillum baldaniorum]